MSNHFDSHKVPDEYCKKLYDHVTIIKIQYVV